MTLGDITLQRLVEPFMHCSYSITPRKHAIKADMITQLRRACLRVGCAEWTGEESATKNGKPVLVVVTEHFSEGHSVHRTHSSAVRSLKESFHVIGLCYEHQVSPPIRDCFDEVIMFAKGGIFDVVKSAAADILKVAAGHGIPSRRRNVAAHHCARLSQACARAMHLLRPYRDDHEPGDRLHDPARRFRRLQ